MNVECPACGNRFEPKEAPIASDINRWIFETIRDNPGIARSPDLMAKVKHEFGSEATRVLHRVDYLAECGKMMRTEKNKGPVRFMVHADQKTLSWNQVAHKWATPKSSDGEAKFVVYKDGVAR